MMITTGRVSQRKINTAASTLPEIGKIKIGEKATNSTGKEYPKALDYFRPTGQFAQAFQGIYGNSPKKLSVCFISDNLGEVCNERYECWVKGKRWGWGDGVNYTVWDSAKKEYVECGAEDSRVKNLQPWDLYLTLRFVLLEMKGIMGYWTFQTKAKKTTIPSIVQAFDFVRERAGTIIGFPFNLLVEKKTGYSPEDPKTYPVVTLVPNFSQESIEMVSEYLEQGGNVNKITTAMIEQKKVLQIENKPNDNNAEDFRRRAYRAQTNDAEIIYALIDEATDTEDLKAFYNVNKNFFNSNPEAEQRLIKKGEALKGGSK